MKKRICFYGLYCYPIFNPEHRYPVGGWEIRMSTIAKELARKENYDVTMIVADYGQPHVEYRDGVQLISWMGKKGGSPAQSETVSADLTSSTQKRKGLRLESRLQERYRSLSDAIQEGINRKKFSVKKKTVLRFLAQSILDITYKFAQVNLKAVRLFLLASKTIVGSFFRAIKQLLLALKQAAHMSGNIYDVLNQNGAHIVWRGDINILDEANADIYIVLGNHHMSAVVANYCIKRKKKYIFCAGSDYDYYPEYKTNPKGRDMYSESYFEKVYAIEHAASHIVQTRRQAEMLKQGYKRNSTLVRNPINLNIVYPRTVNPMSILWVGKADERVKRPSLILELARRLPDYPFVVIMNKAVSETYARCVEEAKSLPNLTLIESVPFEKVEEYFASARLLVSTSVFEGFPNTFLQAAKYGMPIVSTDVDPNNMLSQHGCGVTCGGDFEHFVESVQRLATDDDLYAKMSAAALLYVWTYHDKDIVITQYEKAFREIFSRREISHEK